ncbi:G-protein (beta)-like protein [Trypanosoma grayi]|uniref:G-protein (beta)-like protein n=1 Tax=Trypanosoma grayi TaxID=71804 RepID=UPI0004F4619E|nr:G-protein (beta)-like protein [Trypanosoma grayi]KEG06875.1 G-protein (beta)-like protein [Trypanosoma grayi]
MVRLNLVVLRGVATTLEALLSDASTRRAAVAVLGKLADQHRGDEVFLRAVQNVEPLVRAIQEPEYEYDCVAIARLLGWGGADKAAALVPVRTLEQPCLVTSMAYFRQRDELASATCDGSVVVWGSPHPSTGEVRPATTVELPQRCVPVAMDGASRGNYLVVAGMPFPASSISAIAGENSATGSSGNSNSSSNNNSKRRSLSSGTSKGPLLRLLTCNESTGAWTNGETITRKENVTLTAVAALANLVVCTAESAPSERSPETGLQHDLVLLNGHTTQTMRRFERVHDDYTTIVRVGEDSDHALFTGSRDCVVKVWDTRSSSNRPSLSTAAAVSAATTAGMGASLPRVENAHTDTITAVVPHRKALLTASLDGSLLVWDARRMNAPVHNVHMSAGILDVAPVDGAHVAVSTARGLYLLSLETLNTLDAVPNVTHTQLKASGDGSVIFAAGGNGIGVYALRK